MKIFYLSPVTTSELVLFTACRTVALSDLLHINTNMFPFQVAVCLLCVAAKFFCDLCFIIVKPDVVRMQELQKHDRS